MKVVAAFVLVALLVAPIPVFAQDQGIRQTSLAFPIDPGSGTGGVTITSVNGVPTSGAAQDQPIVTQQASFGQDYKILGPSELLNPSWHKEWSKCESDVHCTIIHGPNCESHEVANGSYFDQVLNFQSHRFCTSPEPVLPADAFAKCVNNTCVLAIPIKGTK